MNNENNQEYWRQRAINYERDWYKRCEETVEKRLARHYMKALTEIKGDILQLYAMLAKENGLDFNEARRILRGREFKEWRFAMSDYLKTHDGGLTKDISTLALRSNITRLEKLHSETLRELDRMGRNVNDDMKKFLSGAYKETYSRDVYDMVKTGKLSVPLAKVDSPNVERVLAARWSGKNYSERIWKNTHLLSRAVRETIATGVHRGLSIEQLSRRLEAKMHAGYSNAERLVQTEMNFVNNQARADSMETAGIMWYEFIAVLDNRTSAPCRSRDGESYPLEEKSVGFNFPPLHPRCRSTVAPYIEELGRRGKRRVKVKGEMVRIPASMTYKDYKAVYIDKKTTLEQWLNKKGVSKAQSTPTAVQNMPVVLQSAPKNSTITPTKNAKATKNDTQKLPLKDQIEPLRQKLLQQKASGASAAEMEVTVKEAGKAIVEEIKKLKLRDTPPGTDIPFDILKSTIESFNSRYDILANNIISGKATLADKAEFAELVKIKNKLVKEYASIECEFMKQNAKRVKSVLSKVRSMGGKLKFDYPIPRFANTSFKENAKVTKKTAETAFNCYPSDWIDESVKRGNIRLKLRKNKRGEYEDDADGFIQLDNKYAFGTSIHELGHHIEKTIYRMLDMEEEFYIRRTMNDRLEKLKDICPGFGYEDYEMTRKDKFIHAYMGKDCGWTAFELVSMGFEYAYTNPKLLLQDEDMAQWIFGLLAIF